MGNNFGLTNFGRKIRQTLAGGDKLWQGETNFGIIGMEGKDKFQQKYDQELWWRSRGFI
jgi:hypothetical protein